MHCTTCGTLLSPGQATCPACGVAAPYNTATESFRSLKAPAKPNPGLSRGKATFLIFVALFMMFSGFFLIYFASILRPAQLHAQATASAETFLTAQTQSATQVLIQATATAHAYTYATATARAVATIQAHATATVLQDIYFKNTSGRPTIYDRLVANDANNWDEGAANGGGGCMFTGEAYHTSMPQKGFYLPCIAESTNLSDFAYQIQMTILKGDSGGLVFRSNSASFKSYRFRISSDGSYSLVIAHDVQNSNILTYGRSLAIKMNQPNLLAVIAKGSNMYFYVNKQYVANASDSTYNTGQIGVFAEDHTNPTELAFNNAQVWIL